MEVQGETHNWFRFFDVVVRMEININYFRFEREVVQFESEHTAVANPIWGG